MENPDVVIIGGGIAGGAMASVLARDGFSVALLEIMKEHRDVVRGEVIVPWGVAEAKMLGLYDLYVSAGAHLLKRLVNYSEDLPCEVSEATAMLFEGALPGIDGGVALGHPRACTMLCEAAAAAGATVLRGVRHVSVTPGARPSVAFEHDGAAHELKPRLVIGADGRHGLTRKQAGIALHEDPVHHWMAGLLVEDTGDWPQDVGSVATVGRVLCFNFPQGGKRSRLYVCMPTEDRTRFAGADGAKEFASAFAMDCVPGSRALAAARPAGEVFGFPNNDTWTDEPFTDGVVLVGDAAGRNDPIIGQGLSIALRDVRLVREALAGSKEWSRAAFAPYAQERTERMRRLRTVSRTFAEREAAWGEEGRAIRRRSNKSLMEHPEAGALFAAITLGPEKLPAEIFSDANVATVLGR